MASAAAGGGDFSDVPQLSSVYDAVSTGCTAQQLHLVLDRAAAAQGSEEARTAAANITGLNGESPLQAAHRLNRGDLVGALLLAGANAENLITTYRANALQLCIFHDQPEDALRALIRSGAPANAEIERHRGEPIGSASYGTCSLLHACLVPPVRESGDPRPPPRLKLLELLAKEGGVDVNTRGNIPPAFDLLLSLGADITAQNNTGFTPLHAVAMFGSFPMVQRLLSAGASAGVVDTWGNTALFFACEKAYYVPSLQELVETLLRATPTEARRSVAQSKNEPPIRAVDALVRSRPLQGPMEPWRMAAIAVLLRSGSPVHPSHMALVLPIALPLHERMVGELASRGLSLKSSWRVHETFVNLALDALGVLEADEAVARREARVAELEVEVEERRIEEGEGMEEEEEEEEEGMEGSEPSREEIEGGEAPEGAGAGDGGGGGA